MGNNSLFALIFVLVWIVPAVAWARKMRWVSAVAMTFLLNCVLGLILVYIVGRVEAWHVIVVNILVIGGSIIAPRFQPTVLWERAHPETMIVWVGAFVLRVWRLGYKELQGDEGVVLERAAGLILGDTSQLFLHQKGPVELLVPMMQWAAAGRMDELWARMPFAWAGAWGVVGVMVLTRMWFGRSASTFAGLTFAIVGFTVAFGRIVQYQSFVVLFGVCAVIHAVEHSRARGEQVRDVPLRNVLVAAGFAAGGLLAHYDGVLILPVLVWVVLVTRSKVGYVLGKRHIPPILLGGAVLALFYVPYLLHPNFGRTLSYLLGDRVGTSAGWNGELIWQMMTFYNSIWFMVGLSGMVLVGMSIAIRVKMMPPILLLGVPLLFYTLIVQDPRTHVYTLFAGACVLAGAGWGGVWQWVTSKWKCYLVFGVWWAAAAVYVILLFVTPRPERQRTWEVNRPTLYGETAPPEYGLFGFPYRAGWATAGQTINHNGSVASNEEPDVTQWYLGNVARTHCADFETVFVAENVQDVVVYEVGSPLFLQRVIEVYGEPKLRVYGVDEPDEVVVQDGSAGTAWRTAAQVAPNSRTGDYALNKRIGALILHGYDLDVTNGMPDGTVTVTLYWEAAEPLTTNYQTFVHLYDEKAQQMWGQHDGAPDCGQYPTTHWELGQIVRDVHVVPIRPDAPTKVPIPILVGAYDVVTLARVEDALVKLDDLFLRP